MPPPLVDYFRMQQVLNISVSRIKPIFFFYLSITYFQLQLLLFVSFYSMIDKRQHQ